MTVYIVDTNVAIVANGERDKQGRGPDPECETECNTKLEEVVDSGTVAVDDSYRIFGEYQRVLAQVSNGRRSPGPGDKFLKLVLVGECRVKRVAVDPSEDDSWGIEALRGSAFDKSDRKFLAVAVAVNGVVVNATDSDWRDHRPLMERLGVEVEELCPHVLRKQE